MGGPLEIPDYGWRLRGRPVGVLPTRDVKLAGREAGRLLDAYSPDAGTLIGCPQCGLCTASCDLVGEDRVFPRTQMYLVQLGDRDALLADPAIWYCHDCGDCSARCPAGARPGRIMGSLRQMAVEHYARPRWLGTIVNRPALVGLLYALTALLVAGVVGLAGSFLPAGSPVIYSAMLPHLALDLFYFGFTALALGIVLSGVARAWRAWRGPMRGRIGAGTFVRALGRTLGDIVLHRSFGSCEENRWRRWSHLSLVVGFVVLFLLAGVVALMDLLGGTYPFPVLHPLKILGNGAGLLLLFGVGLAFARRVGEVRRKEPVSAFDWLLLVHLLVVALTGFAAEIVRYADLPRVAYPIYFVHLVAVFVLLVLLPWSKLAHAAYRTAALVLREALRGRAASRPARLAVPVVAGAARGG